MPLLATTAADVSLRIVGTRYETGNGQPFFEVQSAVLTEEFHVYLPQTRNSKVFMLVQNCTSMTLMRQSRDNFINCSPYLSLDKTLFFLSVLY